jgi:ABC-type nickel/cobalt efflux system permease component RcnA
MNRLRRAYLTLEPGLERYLTTGHHDDERGVIATYMYTLDRPTRQWLWVHFLVNTPTIVATVDAALAAAMVVLGLQAAEAPRAVAVAGGVAAFLLVWGTLFWLQLQTLRPLRQQTPRFPTPPDRP